MFSASDKLSISKTFLAVSYEKPLLARAPNHLFFKLLASILFKSFDKIDLFFSFLYKLKRIEFRLIC